MADEPQKFDPTAIKAEYLAKQHNINRADYLKDGMSDQEFISEYGDKPIGGPESTEPDTSKYIPTPESPESGDSSNLIGAGLGLAAAKAADPYIGAAYAAKYLHDKAPEYISKLGEAFNKSQSMGDKWAFGSEPGVGGVTGNMGPGGDSVTKAAQNYRMQRDLPPEVGQKFGVNRESIIVPKSVAAEEQAARLAAQNSIPGRVSQAVKASSSGLPRKILGTALPWLTFPAAGAEAWDAINKYAPDKELLSRQNIQAGISGLGALGTLASTYPSVPTTVIGGGMGAAAPIVNKMIDMAYSQTPEQFWKPVKSGISSEELSKKLQPGYGTQKLIHKADGGMVGAEPSQGGLNYRDYPNPYGLRAYKNKDGSYGGEMLPKSTGWLGLLAGTGPNKGSVMSEYSIGDEQGDFPSLNPLLDQSQIGRVLGGKMSPDIIQKAMEWRDMQKSKGQSPFYNPPGFNQ